MPYCSNNSFTEEEAQAWSSDTMQSDDVYFDDITGESLNPELVRAAVAVFGTAPGMFATQ